MPSGLPPATVIYLYLSIIYIYIYTSWKSTHKPFHAMECFQIYNLEPCHARVSKISYLVRFRIFEPYQSSKNNIKQLKSNEKQWKIMKNRKQKQWKMMKKRENNNENWWKDWKKTMKHNEKERYKTMKNDEKEKKTMKHDETYGKNNEKWWKIGNKTMKQDET